MVKAKRWGTRIRARILAMALLACGIASDSGRAQQTYQLMVPDGSAYSEASVSANRLEIRDSAGRLTRYDRLAAWDSSDGFWLAFRNPATGQVVRWPSNSRGPVQIGLPDAGNRLRFRESQMQIQALQNLPARPAPGVSLAGNAFGGAVARGDAYWLWDVSNSELIRTDQSLRKTNSSGNVSILTRRDIYPRQLLEKGSTVYVVDEKHGILLFDIYGTYRTILPIHPEGEIRVIDDRLVYRKDGFLHVLEKDLLTEETISLPQTGDGPFDYFKGKLYMLHNETIAIYTK